MIWRLTYVALGWGLIVALALLINGEFYVDVADNAWHLLEAGMVLALLLALAASDRVARLLGALGPVRGVCLAVALGLVGLGQVADTPRATYPFVRWSMYTQPDLIPRYVEYRATLESGRTMHFPFHRVIPTTEPRGLSYKMTGRLQEAYGRRADPAAQRAVERLFVSLIETYNERHAGDDAILHVDIWLRAIPLDDFEGPESVEARHLVRYTVRE